MRRMTWARRSTTAFVWLCALQMLISGCTLTPQDNKAQSETVTPRTTWQTPWLPTDETHIIGLPDEVSSTFVLATERVEAFSRSPIGQMDSPWRYVYESLAPPLASDLKELSSLRQWRYDEDRATLTLALRPGATWHDGQPITSRDVAYAFDVAARYGVDERLSEANVRVMNLWTVEVSFRSGTPRDDVVYVCAHTPLVPRHRFHRVEQGQEGKRPILEDLIDPEWVGSGPYRLVLNDRFNVVLTAVDHRSPLPRHLVLPRFSSALAREAAYAQGSVDLLIGRPVDGKTPPHLDGPESVEMVRLNASSVAFGDGRVRQAFVAMLNRDLFSHWLNEPSAHPLNARQYMTSYATLMALPGETAREAPITGDADRARRLLDEAGVTKGKNGLYSLTADSDSLQLICPDEPRVRTAMRAVADYAMRFGLSIEVVPLAKPAYDERMRRGQYDLVFERFVVDDDPAAIDRRVGILLAGCAQSVADQMATQAARRALYAAEPRTVKEALRSLIDRVEANAVAIVMASVKRTALTPSSVRWTVSRQLTNADTPFGVPWAHLLSSFTATTTHPSSD